MNAVVPFGDRRCELGALRMHVVTTGHVDTGWRGCLDRMSASSCGHNLAKNTFDAEPETSGKRFLCLAFPNDPFSCSKHERDASSPAGHATTIEATVRVPAPPRCGDENCVAGLPAVIAALNELYIVSSAAAQRGAYGLDVRDAQWKALCRATRQAKVVIGQLLSGSETRASVLLRELTETCEKLLDRHASNQGCPTAVWREVARLGREAYECLNLLPTQRS